MKILLKSILFVSIILFACNNSQESKLTPEKVMSDIKVVEDSIKKLNAPNNQDKLRLINSYLSFYHQFPNHKKAPEFLDKVHMTYSGMGIFPRSIAYADTLLKKYPKYINRPMVLESQASSFDVFIQPRDSAKVRYYYNLLLKENQNLDPIKKEGVINRLKNNHLTFEEFIDQQINSVEIN